MNFLAEILEGETIEYTDSKVLFMIKMVGDLIPEIGEKIAAADWTSTNDGATAVVSDIKTEIEGFGDL